MKHLVIWTKAIGSKVAFFDWTKSVWGVLLVATFSGTVAIVFAASNGLNFQQNTVEINDYAVKIILITLIFTVVPAFVIRSAIDLLPISEKTLTSAFEDISLPRWVRRYAVNQLIQESRQRGADAWVALWVSRKAEL